MHSMSRLNIQVGADANWEVNRKHTLWGNATGKSQYQELKSLIDQDSISPTIEVTEPREPPQPGPFYVLCV